MKTVQRWIIYLAATGVMSLSCDGGDAYGSNSSILKKSGLNAIDPINFGWQFAEGDHPDAVQPSFDDSSWETVNLPHDWAIDGPFGARSDSGNTGKLPWRGEGWYRKTFELPASAKGKQVQFIFDGIMANPVVYLNGKDVGSWIYGYNSFHLDVTDAANFGGKNVLTIHADTRQHSSRWYPGAGIYRKITMRLVDPVYIPVWGQLVTTPNITEREADIAISIELTNTTSSARDIIVKTAVIDPSGKTITTLKDAISLEAGGGGIAKMATTVSNPLRWDVNHPHLYNAVSKVFVQGTEVQEETTSFGIRTLEWTSADGFHLNARRLQLYGVNLHHDQGPLGSAFYPRAIERQLQIMKNMGVNAIRTSHNAPGPELIELCDRMGLVVFDELFDKYGATAGVKCSTAEFVTNYAEREVKNFVRRDRNHPSVVLWSIGNEIGDVLANKDGSSPRHVTNMVGYFKQYDPTRDTCMGMHVPSGATRSKHILDALDTQGWNYAEKYVNARKNYPETCMLYSESASAFATRGAYRLTLPENKNDFSKDGYENAYVLTSASWSDIPEPEFERMLKHRYVAGEFVWSGFDYLGEPTPHRTARSSYFGIVDLAGLPKDNYWLYRSHWNTNAHTVQITPHWNWNSGDQVPVVVYTDGDEAELFLNGKSLGRKSKGFAAKQDSNLAFSKTATASSEEIIQDTGGNVLEENYANKAVDGVMSTRWCADSADLPQHLQVDLGSIKEFTDVQIRWEKDAKNYEYTVFVSNNGRTWKPLKSKRTASGTTSSLSGAAQKNRFIKVEVTQAGSSWASISELKVFNGPQAKAENPYYDLVDAYRIRWMNVPYEPGDLKTVAYKDGKKIGESVVRTAGIPSALKLSADRSILNADGIDLCYVTIEMVDKDGNLCPRAMDELHFKVEGAAELKGVANGDQMGHDVFTDTTHSLFYGKAVAVLHSIPGKSGKAVLKVETEDGKKRQFEVIFNR